MYVMWLCSGYKFYFPLITSDFGCSPCVQRKEQELMISHEEISECYHDSPCLFEYKYIWSIHEHAYVLYFVTISF